MAAAKMKRKTKVVKKATKSKAKTAVKAVKAGKKKSMSVSQAYSKAQLVAAIMEKTELSRKQVMAVFESLECIVNAHLSGKGPGMFTLPGLLKMTVQHKPATKARKGINPFSGEPTIFKAKPARRVVKVRALKKLKEMV